VLRAVWLKPRHAYETDVTGAVPTRDAEHLKAACHQVYTAGATVRQHNVRERAYLHWRVRTEAVEPPMKRSPWVRR
jgi:hypothetical protein